MNKSFRMELLKVLDVIYDTHTRGRSFVKEVGRRYDDGHNEMVITLEFHQTQGPRTKRQREVALQSQKNQKVQSQKKNFLYSLWKDGNVDIKKK